MATHRGCKEDIVIMSTNMKKITHDDLVESAARWLRKENYIVITEMSDGVSEKPDAIGWRAGSETTLIECKVSRSDFLSDKKNSTVLLKHFLYKLFQRFLFYAELLFCLSHSDIFYSPLMVNYVTSTGRHSPSLSLRVTVEYSLVRA